jgi:septal ring factor EnvC (AmiA/AmiB activator)
MPDVLEKLSGSVINLILGALIVWVGQTTYQHAGVLAGLDGKFANIEDNFAAVDKRNEGMRKWLENVVTEMKDTNRLQFTAKEGDKVVAQIRKVEDSTYDLERKLSERLNALEVKIAALEMCRENSQQVASLQAEVAQLRFVMTQSALPPAEVSYQPAQRLSQRPVYLPPVGSPR